MFFSVITKNLNWEVLTKNLFTFKRRNEVKEGLTLWGITEKSDFSRSSRKDNILRELRKKGGLGSFQI